MLRQRLKTPYAEVDLLFRAPSGNLILVEVKTSNSADFLPARVNQRQWSRLARAAQFLAARFDCLVEFHWAFVDSNFTVTVFEEL